MQVRPDTGSVSEYGGSILRGFKEVLDMTSAPIVFNL